MELSLKKSGQLVAIIQPETGSQRMVKYLSLTVSELKKAVSKKIFDQGYPKEWLINCYLLHNGKILQDNLQLKDLLGSHLQPIFVSIVPRTPGGKGGFGSMLRAIGNQIEKSTTNLEACRDLSGRRLRDINEERRLKKWHNQQNERKEALEKAKVNKLDKLRKTVAPRAGPLQSQTEFLQETEDIAESLYEAVDEGFQNKCEESTLLKNDKNPVAKVDHSSYSRKRGGDSTTAQANFKKLKFDEELDSGSDDAEEIEEDKD